MYKIILDLGSINKTMRLKFNLMIEHENQVKQAINRQDTRTISSFMMGGTEYLKLTPFPYVSIDISKTSDRGDKWNSNLTANLNSAGMFIMQKKLKQILSGFQVKNLFYKQDGRLYVNQSVASQMIEYIRLPSKTLKVMYAVVKDEENQEIEYEGVVLMINTSDNYCFLTYDELEYLIYALSKVDIHVLSLQAIQLYMMKLSSNIKPSIAVSTFSEKKEVVPETTNYAKIVEPSEIPNI